MLSALSVYYAARMRNLEMSSDDKSGRPWRHGDGLIVAQSIHTIELTDGSIKIEGLLNDHVAKGTHITDIPVLGCWDDWI